MKENMYMADSHDINISELVGAINATIDYCRTHDVSGWSQLRLMRRDISATNAVSYAQLMDIRDWLICHDMTTCPLSAMVEAVFR